jgi:hypothetical protein
MPIEIRRDALLSLYARTAAVFRERADQLGPKQAHDYGVTVGRARMMEECLRRTRATESEHYILVDGNVENLMNIAGVINTKL